MVLVLVKCGFDNYSKVAEAKRQSTITTLENTNKDNIKTIEKQEKVAEESQLVVTENIQTKKVIETKVQKNDEKRKHRLENIERKYGVEIKKINENTRQPESVKAEQRKKVETENAVETSKAQIDHLWNVYCTATNSKEPACLLPG